jgi:hypothetical protein
MVLRFVKVIKFLVRLSKVDSKLKSLPHDCSEDEVNFEHTQDRESHINWIGKLNKPISDWSELSNNLWF